MYGGLAPRRAPASVPSSELFFGQMPDPVLLTSASASTMGARVDPGATFTFSVLLALYVWGQVKIRGALAAKEAREALEKEFNSVRAANLAGEISSSELDEAKAKIMDLKQKEEEARAVNFLGLKSRLVVPGLLPSVDEPSPLAPTSSAQQEQVGLKQPQPQQQKLQDEDDSPMRGFNGGQVALLSLVVLSQLWLLTVLSEDPMKFLQD